MITVRHTELINMDVKTFIKTVIADIDCDTLADVPKVDGLNGYILHQGSTVDVIKEGYVLKLSGDNKWCNVAGEVIKEG